jgi:hypothetical protein
MNIPRCINSLILELFHGQNHRFADINGPKFKKISMAPNFPPKNHHTKNNLIVSSEKTPTSAVIGDVCRGIILLITRVPERPSLRPNWLLLSPLPQASVSPPGTKGGQHSLGGEGAGGANSDDWRQKPGTLYTLWSCSSVPVKGKWKWSEFSGVFA